MRDQIGWQRHRDQRGNRPARHGRNVAQAASHRLVADLLRLRRRGKMDALHDCVRLEQQIAARLAGIQHGAIIARPGNDRGITRQGNASIAR